MFDDTTTAHGDAVRSSTCARALGRREHSLCCEASAVSGVVGWAVGRASNVMSAWLLGSRKQAHIAPARNPLCMVAERGCSTDLRIGNATELRNYLASARARDGSNGRLSCRRSNTTRSRSLDAAAGSNGDGSRVHSDSRHFIDTRSIAESEEAGTPPVSGTDACRPEHDA